MASLLSLGNPLSSERGEPRALGHLAKSREEPGFAGCQRLNFLGDATRAPLPRSPERNLTWMWTLILSLSWLAQSSLQAAYRISLAYSGPTLAFNENFGGDIFEGALDNYFVYNNYNPAVLLGPCKLRIYSSSGNELTSIDAGPSNSEGPTFPQPSKAVILGQTTGIYVFTVSEQAGSVAVSLDTSLSATSLNHVADFASSVSEPSSSLIFATHWNLLSSTVKFYKIRLGDVSDYSTYTLPAGYGMTSVSTLAFGPADTLMGMGNGNLVFLAKASWLFVKTFSNPGLGYFVLAEPTDQTVAYAGSRTGLSESLSKIDTSSLTWELLLPTMSVSAFVVNLVRIPIFRVGLFTEALLATIRVFDIDTMAVLASQNVGGSLSRVSLTYGKIIGKSFFSGIVNPVSTNLQIYNLTLDFCTIAWQNPCLACEAGRYLSGNSLENNCLKPSEFPKGYGIQGQIIAPCQTGCLKCTSDASVCTLCDDTNGYYLYPATSGCLLVNQIPDTFGLDKTTSPFSISSCTEPQCRRCRSDREICDSCLDNYYLLEPTDGTCRQNNTIGFGSILVSGQGRLTACSDSECSDCRADYSTCLSCLPNRFRRANEGSGCFANNVDSYGLYLDANPFILRKCSDPNCKECFLDHKICTACNLGLFVIERPITQGPQCIPNALIGYGITNGIGTKISTCDYLNCANCFVNTASCEGCVTGTYLADFQAGCFLNQISGFGLKEKGAAHILSACITSNCQDCRTDVTSCMNCTMSFILEPISRTCVENNVPGMGRSIDQAANHILKKCDHDGCADCYSDHRICVSCKVPSFVADTIIRKCVSKASQDTMYQLKPIQPSYYNGKLKTFTVQFTEPLLLVATDLNELLQFNLVRQSGREYSSAEYSVKVAVTTRGELSGEFSALGFIEESSLTMTQKNKSQILFRSASATFSPTSSLETRGISFVPRSPAETTAAALTQQTLAGVSAASFVGVLTSGSGGGRLAMLFSVIEYIEYVLYVDGKRVLRGDNFLYFFSFDPLQLIPNWLAPNEGGVRCDPGPNFARGQMGCNFLTNSGTHIQMILISSLGVFLFTWLLPKGIDKLKSPKAKTVLQAVNYIPSHFFSPSLLLTFVEGPQIDIIRSALLNLLIYPTHRTQTNLLGLIVSLLAIGFYGLYAFKLARIAWDLRSQPPGAQVLPSNQFFRETFERINLPKSEIASIRETLRLITPTLVIIKNAIIQGLIVMLAGRGLIQIYMVLLMQIANLGLWTLVRPYKLMKENFAMMVVAAAKLCISICLIIVNTRSFNINFEEREKYFGWLLVSLYSSCIGAVLFGLVYDLGCSIKEFCRKYREKRKGTLDESEHKSIKKIHPMKTGLLKKGDKQNSVDNLNQHRFKEASLKNIAPISSMQKIPLHSQKMVKIIHYNRVTGSSKDIAIKRPLINNAKRSPKPRSMSNLDGGSETSTKLFRKVEMVASLETAERNSTDRRVKDPKASFVSISSTNNLAIEHPKASRSIANILELPKRPHVEPPKKPAPESKKVSSLGAPVENAPSFRHLPTLNKSSKPKVRLSIRLERRDSRASANH